MSERRAGLVYLAIALSFDDEITLRAFIAIVGDGGNVLLSGRSIFFADAPTVFLRERYDMRRGLLDFGPTRSVATALDRS